MGAVQNCDEVWKSVVGFPSYKVSSFGRVRSVDREIPPYVDKIGRKQPGYFKAGKIISSRAHVFGYDVVTLSENGKPYTRTVHKLVAEAFLGPKRDDQVVRHLDGNPKNNHVDNLEYGSQADNMQDAIKHGTVEFGEKRYNAKWNNQTIRAIKRDLICGCSFKEISEKFKMSEIDVWKIAHGKKWNRVGFQINMSLKRKFLTDEEKSEVLKLRSEGLTYKQIAQRFDVSKTQILNTVKKYENHKN